MYVQSCSGPPKKLWTREGPNLREDYDRKGSLNRIPKNNRIRENSGTECQGFHFPIGSMGLVDLPIGIYTHIYTIHGSYKIGFRIHRALCLKSILAASPYPESVAESLSLCFPCDVFLRSETFAWIIHRSGQRLNQWLHRKVILGHGCFQK